MADMFGSPTGVVAYDQDYLKGLSTGVDATETLGKIAMQPLQADRLRAEAGHLDAQTAKLNAELKAEEALARIATNAKGAESGQGNIADQLDSMARAAMDAGLVTKATDLASKAALVRQRNAAEISSLTTAAKNDIQGMQMQANLVGQYYGNVKSADDWENANALWEFNTGQPSPYTQLPYDPATVKTLSDAAMTVKDRATHEDHRITQTATEAYRASRLKQHDLLRGIAASRLDLARQRETRLAKVTGGVKGSTTPTKSEMQQAEDLILKDYPKMDGVDEARFTIASDARALVKANPALTIDAAIRQAYNTAVQAGDFQTDSGILGTGLKAKTSFTGTGKSAATAAPLPPDRTKWVKDRFYVSPTGAVGKWNGKTFSVVGGAAGRPLSGNNGAPDPADDEDDDD